ncbi:MAG: PDGLE domain-containing protein [Candidatus Poribacteria bacterium]
MKSRDIIIGIVVSMFLAGLISIFASSWPDGLEKVAEDIGFLEKGEVEPPIKSPIPDYTFPGIKNEKLATSISGILGTAVVFVLGYGVSALIKRKDQHRNQ